MRVVNGKQITEKGSIALAAWRERYQEAVVDFGAGDDRLLRHLSAHNPSSGTDIDLFVPFSSAWTGRSRTFTGHCSGRCRKPA